MSKQLSMSARAYVEKLKAAHASRKAELGFPPLSEHSVVHDFARMTAPRSKYGARKVRADGHTFDSWLEFSRYQVLKDLQAREGISCLELQKAFELQPRFHKNGHTYRPIVYLADFVYKDAEGKTVVEDTKGFKTEAFMLKKKMFEYKFQDLTLRIIDGHSRKNTRG